MSNQFPIIEMTIKNLGFEVGACIALHTEEIEAIIKQSINLLLEHAVDDIATDVRALAKQKILEEASMYFSHGRGAQAIKEAVDIMAQPILDSIAVSGRNNA